MGTTPRLSPAQRAVLERMAAGAIFGAKGFAYELIEYGKINVQGMVLFDKKQTTVREATGDLLINRGLIARSEKHAGWEITPAGRAALADRGEG